MDTPLFTSNVSPDAPSKRPIECTFAANPSTVSLVMSMRPKPELSLKRFVNEIRLGSPVLARAKVSWPVNAKVSRSGAVLPGSSMEISAIFSQNFFGLLAGSSGRSASSTLITNTELNGRNWGKEASRFGAAT